MQQIKKKKLEHQYTYFDKISLIQWSLIVNLKLNNNN